LQGLIATLFNWLLIGLVAYFGDKSTNWIRKVFLLGGLLESSLIDLRFMVNSDVYYLSPYFGDM